MMSTSTQKKSVPLYERCGECQGTGEAPPDTGIHRTLPEHSGKVCRKRRAIPAVCTSCQGAGFEATALTVEWVMTLAEEHRDTLNVLQELVDLFNVSELEEGVSYLSDGALLGINMLSEQILDRARAAGRPEPTRHGLRKSPRAAR
jgi:hypothetical protein